MLRIVTDGAGDMPETWKQEFDIEVIPINIHFDEKRYLQGVDLSNEDFYRLVDEKGIIPKTSQPSPQQFIDFYRRIALPGDTIISMHVTRKLSGTLDSAVAAAKELQGKYEVIPFDSASGSAALGFMCREARQMERGGATPDAIMERMEYIRQNIHILLTLDTLEYARRSGRVKALQAALASLLNVKPVVELRQGVLDMADRVRTRRRALEFVMDSMCQRLGNRPVNAAVVHARDPESGKLLMDRVHKHLNCQTLVLTDLSISVAANLGPGTVGIVAYPIEEG